MLGERAWHNACITWLLFGFLLYFSTHPDRWNREKDWSRIDFSNRTFLPCFRPNFHRPASPGPAPKPTNRCSPVPYKTQMEIRCNAMIITFFSHPTNNSNSLYPSSCGGGGGGMQRNGTNRNAMRAFSNRITRCCSSLPRPRRTRCILRSTTDHRTEHPPSPACSLQVRKWHGERESPPKFAFRIHPFSLKGDHFNPTEWLKVPGSLKGKNTMKGCYPDRDRRLDRGFSLSIYERTGYRIGFEKSG